MVILNMVLKIIICVAIVIILMIPSLLDLYYCDDCNVTFISKDEYDRNMTRIVKGLTKFYSVLNTYENNKVVNNLINDIDHVLNMYGKTNNMDLTPIFEWKRKYFYLCSVI